MVALINFLKIFFTKENIEKFVFLTFFACTKKVTKKCTNFSLKEKFDQKKIWHTYKFKKTQLLSA